MLLLALCYFFILFFTPEIHCEGTEDLSFVREFSNLHITESLKQAKDSILNLCGVYCIKNTITGAMYIGSSIRIGERLVDHVFNYSSNVYLQYAIAKYGLAAFTFLVVEFCTKDLLLEREQHWLNWLFTLPSHLRYNFSPTAGSPLGVVRSEETKAKIGIEAAPPLGASSPSGGSCGQKEIRRD